MNLYHYTDQNGFIGIFKSKTLWATKIQYLNDSNEYYLAIKIAKEIINEKIEKEKDLEVKFTYQEFITRTQLITNLNLCVCSLTEQGDLLSQWRGYSRKMGGYSIGFDFEGLKATAEKNRFELVKCIYDESIQREKIELIIKESIDLMGQDAKYGIHRKSINHFENEIMKLAPTLKDSSFSEEAEWRLISLCNTELLNFRAGNSMIIPYNTLSLGNKIHIRKMLKEVIVGHTPHTDLAIQATQSFLINTLLSLEDYPLSIAPFNVLKSKIPYRSW